MNTDENLDQNIELPKKEDEDVKKQRTRSFLRERFLRIITSLVGTGCRLHMYSNTSVSGEFKGCDIDFQNLLVEKLKTPFVEVPHSKIRVSDVNYIEFDSVKQFCVDDASC